MAGYNSFVIANKIIRPTVSNAIKKKANKKGASSTNVKEAALLDSQQQNIQRQMDRYRLLSLCLSC